MYVFPEMLELTKIKFPTKAHQSVAEKVLLCNPRYTTLSGLINGATIIAAIPKGLIKKVTLTDLWQKGILIDAPEESTKV